MIIIKRNGMECCECGKPLSFNRFQQQVMGSASELIGSAVPRSIKALCLHKLWLYLGQYQFHPSSPPGFLVGSLRIGCITYLILESLGAVFPSFNPNWTSSNQIVVPQPLFDYWALGSKNNYTEDRDYQDWLRVIWFCSKTGINSPIFIALLQMNVI